LTQYAQLRNGAKKDRSHEIVRAASLARKADRNLLTDTSYLNQKAYLTNYMGEENAHLVEGVLYYRVSTHVCGYAVCKSLTVSSADEERIDNRRPNRKEFGN
jgi:nicotinamide riboside kinase